MSNNQQQQPQQQQNSVPLVEEALAYLRTVKQTFLEDQETYNKFLDIMRESRDGRIERAVVLDQVSDLFNEHPNLIVGFNSFLRSAPENDEDGDEEDEDEEDEMEVEDEEDEAPGLGAEDEDDEDDEELMADDE